MIQISSHVVSATLLLFSLSCAELYCSFWMMLNCLLKLSAESSKIVCVCEREVNKLEISSKKTNYIQIMTGQY